MGWQAQKAPDLIGYASASDEPIDAMTPLAKKAT